MKKVLYHLLVFLFVITIGCKKEENDNIQDNDPFKVQTLIPLPDNIPYQDLGSGKILFERFYENSESDFYIIDIDNRKSSGFKLKSRITQPQISPSGDKIACSLLNSSEPGAAWNVHIMNTDGSDCFPVFKSDQDESFPAWSSDGSKIIYSTAGPEGGLNMQSPVENSSDRVELIKFHYDDAPGWEIKPSGGFTLSRSGMLAGVSTSETIDGLIGVEPYLGKAGVSILLSPEDLNIQLLKFAIETPVFSPDGSKIAFLSTLVNEDGLSLIVYIIDPDGNNLLSAGGGGGFKPDFYRPGLVSMCWSPDGTKFLFTFPVENSSLHLYVIDLDGSMPLQVTNQTGSYDTRVSWCK